MTGLDPAIHVLANLNRVASSLSPVVSQFAISGLPGLLAPPSFILWGDSEEGSLILERTCNDALSCQQALIDWLAAMSKKVDYIPIPPNYEEASNALIFEVGRVVVMQSTIDKWLRYAFATLNDGIMEPEESAERYYSFRNFNDRLKLVDAAIKMLATRAEQAEWSRIHTELHEQKAVRNKVAHLGLSYIGAGDSVGAMLANTIFLKKKEEVRIDAIKRSAEALGVLKVKVQRLGDKIGKSREASAESRRK